MRMTSRPAFYIPVILAGLLALTALPSLMSGWVDLEAAADHRSAGQFMQASSRLESAARRLPWRTELWEQAGLAALEGGAAGRAVRLLESARGRGRISHAGLLGLGDALYRLDDPASALKVWQEMVAAGEVSSDVYRRLAQEYLRLGMFPEAAESYRQLTRLEPDDAAAHFQLGLLLAAHTPRQALPELVRAASLDPQLDPAARELRSAINVGLLSEDPAYQLVVSGRGLAALGEWRLAESAFNRATLANPPYGEAWAWLAEAMQQRGEDSLALLRKAGDLSPQSAMVSGLQGVYWLRAGKSLQAFESFRDASRLEPLNPAWLAAQGDAIAQMGDLPEALKRYQRAVELSAGEAEYWRRLALFCADFNVQLSEIGLPAAFSARQASPNDPENQFVLGRVLLEINYLASAETVLLDALEALPDDARIHLYLGLLYLRKEQPQPAYHHFILARDVDRDGVIASQASRLLDVYFP